MILTLSAVLFEGMTDVERTNFWALIYALVGSPIPHALLLDTAEDVSARRGPVAAWLAPESPDHQHLVRGLLERGPMVAAAMPRGGESASEGCWRRAGPLRVTVKRCVLSDWRVLQLTLADALLLLKEPVRLLLENSRNDLAFIRGLSGEAQRRRIGALEEAPEAPFVAGGGTGELEAALKPLAERDTLSEVELRRLWKTWVMFDMDAGAQDATQPSVASDRLVRWCEQIHTKHGVPLSWVRLQRREIESYLPDAALPTRGERRATSDWIKAARSSPDLQRMVWAYDMKKGLLGDLSQSVTEDRRSSLKSRREVLRQDDLKPPFDTLDDASRSALAPGFGKNVLNDPLNAVSPPDWLELLGEEYDRGPTHQLPRAALIQSMFDRM